MLLSHWETVICCLYRDYLDLCLAIDERVWDLCLPMSVQWPLLAEQRQTMKAQLGPRSDKEKYNWDMWQRQINQGGRAVFALPKYRFQNLKLSSWQLCITLLSVYKCKNGLTDLKVTGKTNAWRKCSKNEKLFKNRMWKEWRQIYINEQSTPRATSDLCISPYETWLSVICCFYFFLQKQLFAAPTLKKQKRNPTGRPEEQ